MNIRLILVSLGLTVSLCGVAWGFDEHDHRQPAQLRYNPYESTWGYERPSDELRYNPYQQDWSYQDHEEQLQYNPFEESWEWEE